MAEETISNDGASDTSWINDGLKFLAAAAGLGTAYIASTSRTTPSGAVTVLQGAPIQSSQTLANQSPTTLQKDAGLFSTIGSSWIFWIILFLVLGVAVYFFFIR